MSNGNGGTMTGGWKTILGALLVAVAPVVEQYKPGAIGAGVQVVQGLGVILAALGLRHAISKNGKGV